MNTNTAATTQTAHMATPLDMDERLTAGDQYRVAAVRKHRATRTRDWRVTDGQTHPVTISRRNAS